jgi:DNA-binding MarR family transcriptional regulator
MRRGQLTRNQAAILWLIHYEGFEHRCMRRKDIERSLKTWLEVSSSGITKALRGMCSPSLSLLKILENPDSTREKQVILTSKGEKFLQHMITEGRNRIRKLIAHFADDELGGGMSLPPHSYGAVVAIWAAAA